MVFETPSENAQRKFMVKSDIREAKWVQWLEVRFHILLILALDRVRGQLHASASLPTVPPGKGG
jgi:hypothetical protein